MSRDPSDVAGVKRDAASEQLGSRSAGQKQITAATVAAAVEARDKSMITTVDSSVSRLTISQLTSLSAAGFSLPLIPASAPELSVCDYFSETKRAPVLRLPPTPAFQAPGCCR